MQIDAHQHFWKFDPVRDAWIDDSMRVLQKDFLPEDLIPLLQANQIDGCIAVQADQSEEETQFLLKLAEKYSEIKAVVGWIDLLNLKVEDRLAYFSEFKKLKGFRHIVQAEPKGFMLTPEFQNGLSKLAKFGFIYEILVYAHQLPDAIEIVQKHPEITFLLDHLGKPNVKTKEIELWQKNISQLAQFPNVHCKISGLITEADWSSWTYEQFVPYLDIITKEFGPDRMLFGSDWPVCLVAGEYEATVDLVKNYISKFSAEEQASIMSKNAVELYNLK
ncbi:amidohydrolase family protein [Gramella sp. AN32]|uniref:Amidohydrolase family protein n=1 Tax=Christiangramia antarctica TaxID=2058158 RepID=A0ABW5X0I9_9FLAO|nr:amidohydrolase family protein [Gramella sp. AN32]MCM4156924.1 amidohydrolase [Gramella sp. AN32]